MVRARFLLPVLAVLVLAAAPFAAGCSTQDSGSSTGTATTEPASGGSGSGYTTVDVQTAYDALSSNDAAQLVDVREPSEWAETGVPEGAVLIPLGDLEARASELKTDQPVYVICRSGNRSRTGSDILAGLGFGEVYNVDGGVNAWTAAGLPMETYQP